MTKTIQTTLASALLTAAALAVSPARAQTGTVAGTVADAVSGETLPGANVRLAETSAGAATALDGTYRISGVPAGEATLVASFVGYTPDTLTVTVAAGETARLDFALASGIVGAGVEVSAQLEGQLAAIDQQRTSNTIVNVVSADRIRELPDANAAESVGRLPGVSLQRDGGEGTRVQVRGLDPSFTSVTINGERIPGSGGGDFEDGSGGGRSVDLSLISADLLEGIELFKALTPDKDADAIGGAVNLVVREAPGGFRGRVRTQGTYNELASGVDGYRLDGNVSNRFWDDRVGVIATANLQRAPRGYAGSQADYTQSFSRVEPRSLEVDRRDETRTRTGASLTTDLRLPGGGLQARALYSRSERDEERLRLRYRIGETDAERAVREQARTNDLVSTGLSGTHALGRLGVVWNVSASQSLGRTPEGIDARFRQDDAFAGLASTDFSGAPLTTIADSAGLALERTYLRSVRRVRERTLDRDLTSALDLDLPVVQGPLAVELRTGGKVRLKRRTSDYTRSEVTAAGLEGYAEDTGLPLLNGRDDPAAAPYFLGDAGEAAGAFALLETPDRAAIAALDANLDGLYREHPFFDLRDYEADEDVAAAYALAEIDAGGLLVVGGVRYEHTDTAFRAGTGEVPTDLQRIDGIFRNAQRANPDTLFADVFALRDTTGGQRYGAWFPQVVARYRVSPVVDVRAAATRTLARPDYVDLVAYENVDEIDNEIDRGNPLLRPTLAWNYDAGVSAYTPIGLFAVGGFYKRLGDFAYDRIQVEQIAGEGQFLVTETVNGEAASVYGVEVDAQLNTALLPGALSGLILTANYAYTQSRADFPIQYSIGLDTETFQSVLVSETRRDALPGQATHIANATLGYERSGFSARLSVSHQGAFLVGVTPSTFDADRIRFLDDPATEGLLDLVFDDPETDEVEGGPVTQAEIRTGIRTRPYTFVDLSVSQDVAAVPGLRLLASASNLTDQFERRLFGADRATFERGYGLTAEVGLQYAF